MTEEERWVREIFIEDEKIQKALQAYNPNLAVEVGQRLLYAYQARSYKKQRPESQERKYYQTDVLVSEKVPDTDQEWTPRVIIEAKIDRIGTHGAITYSQKAADQKSVHPYLRYGILLGNFERLPGRLLQHGFNFDFMVPWKNAFEPSEEECKDLIKLICEEVRSSQQLEKLFFDSKKRDRERYTFLHRPLILRPER